MWITAIISYPLALILDFIIGARKDRNEVFTNNQLAILMKSQERSENNPVGKLGKDATRVVLGALNLDGRRIDRVMADPPEQPSDADEKDVEKAEISVVHGMIVKWYAVKTIDINEPVDQDFIDKIRSWSYSRIPVIGKSGGKATQSEIWEGTKIFGFLHIKVRVC
jgi:metal transporter CNNM